MFDFLIKNATVIEIWLGAACTLGLYSILYKENKIYRFFEHLYIGLATGWAVRVAWIDILEPAFYKRIIEEGRWWWLFVLPFGIMLYFIYTKKYNWMSRITIGIMMGLDAGQQFQRFSGQYYNQVRTTFKPILPQAAAGTSKAVSWSGAINNLLFLVILICVMSYFLFSFEQKNKVFKRMADSGRWMLMIAFGAIFGSTIMARMALCIERIDWLMHKWLALFIPWLRQ